MLTTAPSTSSTSSAPQPKYTLAPHSDTCSSTISFVALWSGRRGSERTADTSPSGCSGGSASSATCISDTPARCGTGSLVGRSTVARRRPSVPASCSSRGREWCWSGEGPDRRGRTKPCRASPALCWAWGSVRKGCDWALSVIEDFGDLAGKAKGNYIWLFGLLFPWLHIRWYSTSSSPPTAIHTPTSLLW